MDSCSGTTVQTDGNKDPLISSNSNNISLSVNEMWEKTFREVGEDNSELLVSGVMLFYPTYIMAYCEVKYADCCKLR